MRGLSAAGVACLTLELALMTEPQIGGSYDDLLTLATWAEAQQLDAFARSDHYLNGDESAPATDAFATLAGLARETQRIQLVVLVTPLTFRHPGVIAKMATTIDQMSGGRFALGVGTGWMEQEHGVFGIELYDTRERFSRLYETLAYLRAAFSGEGYQGRHYALEPTALLPPPTGELPIIVGGTGPKRTPELAGRFADEYNFFIMEEKAIEARLEVMRASAASADRDPAAITVSTMAWMVVAEDEAAYRRLVQQRATARNMAVADFESLLQRRNIPRGTPERAAETVARLAELGVDRTYVQMLQPLDEIDPEWLQMVVGALRSI